VVLDRAGLDVTPSILQSKDAIKKHAQTVAARNAEIALSNKAIDEQLVPLRKSLEAKKIELANCTDAPQKAALEAQVADLQQQVTSLGAKKQPVTVIIGPTKFPTRDAAEAYIEQVRQESGAANAKSDSAKEPAK
jgi:phage-related minor tail protein